MTQFFFVSLLILSFAFLLLTGKNTFPPSFFFVWFQAVSGGANNALCCPWEECGRLFSSQFARNAHLKQHGGAPGTYGSVPFPLKHERFTYRQRMSLSGCQGRRHNSAGGPYRASASRPTTGLVPAAAAAAAEAAEAADNLVAAVGDASLAAIPTEALFGVENDDAAVSAIASAISSLAHDQELHQLVGQDIIHQTAELHQHQQQLHDLHERATPPHSHRTRFQSPGQTVSAASSASANAPHTPVLAGATASAPSSIGRKRPASASPPDTPRMRRRYTVHAAVSPVCKAARIPRQPRKRCFSTSAAAALAVSSSPLSAAAAAAGALSPCTTRSPRITSAYSDDYVMMLPRSCRVELLEVQPIDTPAWHLISEVCMCWLCVCVLVVCVFTCVFEQISVFFIIIIVLIVVAAVFGFPCH